MNHARRLKGKVAIVTGAGAGIGRAIAEELARDGGRIAVADIDASSAEESVARLQELGADARAYALDVSKRADVDNAVASVIRDFGGLDILVNNAGVSRVGPHTQDTTDEDWHLSVDVMQTGVFYCMRAAGKHFLDQRSGSVVNVSSIRGFSPNPGRIAYCAAKAAVIMMTRVAAAEWAPHGVRVNAVAPGVVRTPMWDSDVARGVIDEERYLSAVPARRLGAPAEIGRLIAYLCSDDAAYINGTCVTIDGALTSVPIG